MLKIILAVLLLASPALGQSPVLQSGTVTPGHATQWVTNGVVADAGTAAQGTLTSLGITAQGPSFCQNSDLVTNPFVQMCLGVNTSSAAVISLASLGGAADQTLCFDINGSQTCLPLGFPGTFAVSGTPPIVVDPTTGNITCSNFTNSVSGCVPGSGGGTANFMRADGSWAVPSGSGIGTVTSATIAAGTGISVSGTCTITTTGTCTVAAAAPTYSYQTVNTGFSFTISDGTGGLQIDTATPSYVLAAGTVTLPPHPTDGQVVTVSSGPAITALTINPNSGQSVNWNGGGVPFSLPQNSGLSVQWVGSDSNWFVTTGPPGQILSIAAANCFISATCTTITGGTNGRVLYNNNGVLGQLATTGSGNAVLATAPSVSSLTVTSAFTATGLVTNADLANASTTVNSQTCTLGSTCTVPAVTSVTCNGGLTGGAITTTGTCAVDIATNTNFWGGTTSKIVDAHVAQTALAVTALTVSTTTFTTDLSLGLNFSVTLLTSSCSCTMASPTNVFAGASGFIELIQPASGGPATITSWGGNWKFPGGVKPTLSTTANAKDIIPYFCDATNFCMVGAIQLAFQ